MINYHNRRYAVLVEYFRKVNRYIYDEHIEEILNSVKDIIKDHIYLMNEGARLYRSQIGSDFIEKNGSEHILPFSKERMYPRPNQTLEGRANPKGISYLYLASNEKTSLSEVRAWPGQQVSTCIFSNNIDLRLVDLSKEYKTGLGTMFLDFEKNEILSEDSNENLLGEINKAFTTPVRNTDDTSDYVLTQVIAELIKSEGYDGIVYNSFFTDKGKNIVIFDREKVDIKNGLVYEITRIDIDYKQISNPVKYK
jgi:hypothetical protein